MLSFLWHFSLSNNLFLGISIARSISFRTSLELYPLSKRNFSKSLQRLSKDLVSEQMRFNLKAWLYSIHFLQWKGCRELDCKYWWLSVGLTYQSVSITPSTRDTVTSKKTIEVFDHSAVNLMIGNIVQSWQWRHWGCISVFNENFELWTLNSLLNLYFLRSSFEVTLLNFALDNYFFYSVSIF